MGQLGLFPKFNLLKMGYIKHNAIIVTGWQEDKVLEARNKAIEIFEECFNGEPKVKPYGSKLISEIIPGLINGQSSFFIAPDGSKEGWETSQNGDMAREQFCKWLDSDQDNYCDYIEVRFGGDDDHEMIIRSIGIE
jgi:hypothetical protein